MGKAQVVERVRSLCEGIDGINAAQAGYYEPLDGAHASLPLIAVKAGRSRWAQVTATEILATYQIKIRVYLANWDALDTDVEHTSFVVDDQLRAAFYADRLLNNNCIVSTLQQGEHNLETYKDQEEGYAYHDYWLEVVEQRSKTDGVEDMYGYSGLLSKSYDALQAAGWEQLGRFQDAGVAFRESDIIYLPTDPANPESGYYYCFNTESGGGGNIPGWNTVNVSQWYTNGDGTVTIVTATDHGVPPTGQTSNTVKFSGLTANAGGSVGNLTNISGLRCIAYSPRILVALSVANVAESALTATGTGGAAGNCDPRLNVALGLRRAKQLGALTGVSGADYVSQVGQGSSCVYYPTVVYIPPAEGGPKWYVFGISLGAGVAHTGRMSYSGNAPLTRKAVVSETSNVTTLPYGDHHIRRNPVDGYYYCVVQVAQSEPYTDVRIYKCAASDIGNDNWQFVANVWDDIGVPSWAAYAIPDPTLIFTSDGRAYMTFGGRITDPTDNSNAIVELNASTFRAKNPVLMLQIPPYPSWHTGLLSDVCYLSVDGRERLIGFENLTENGTGYGTWGQLDLGTTG